MSGRLAAFILRDKFFWPFLAVLYIISRLATWGYPFDSDHWIFFYVGNDWFHGGSLYVTAWDHKPPLVFFFNGIMSVVLGSSIVLHRILFTLLSLLDIYLFYRLCKRVAPSLVPLVNREPEKRPGSASGPSVAIGSSKTLEASSDLQLFTRVALIVFVFWANLSQFTSSGNNAENFGLPFLLGMLLGFLAFREDQRAWRLLFSGSCLSVLFFLKGNFLLLGLPPLILLITAYRREPKKLLFSLGVFLLPLLVQSGAWVAYFSSQGTLHDFFVAAFSFSGKYAASAWHGDLSSSSVRLASLLTLLLFLAPFLALARLYLSGVRSVGENEAYWLMAMLAVASLGLTLDVGSFYAYYFLIAMPAFAIIMAVGILRIGGLQYDLKRMLIFAATICVVISLGISMKQLANSFTGYAYAEAQEYQRIADYVRMRTRPSDKVFDYDYGATFYQLANRSSGSRFVSASVMLLDYRDHYGFHLNKTFIEDMNKAKTKYLILYRDQSNVYYENRPLVAYFRAHYVLEKKFPTFEVLRRRMSS